MSRNLCRSQVTGNHSDYFLVLTQSIGYANNLDDQATNDNKKTVMKGATGLDTGHGDRGFVLHLHPSFL
jgi:hypothetical protein